MKITSELKERIKPITAHLKITRINILYNQSLFQNKNKYPNSRKGYSVWARETSKSEHINMNSPCFATFI